MAIPDQSFTADSSNVVQSDSAWHYDQEGYSFYWDLQNDHASLTQILTKKTIWKGGLLPEFWLIASNGKKQYVKGKLQKLKHIDKNKFTAELQFGEFGLGEMEVEADKTGVQINKLKVT